MITDFKIFEQTRSQSLDKDAFGEIIKTECSWSLNNNLPIFYRRKTEINGQYTSITPSSFHRNARGMLVSEMIDQLPSWNDYPKRSKSVSVLGNTVPNDEFGPYLYKVYPKKGSKVVISVSRDLNFGVGFPLLKEKTNIGNFSDIVEFTEKHFRGMFAFMFDKDIKTFLEDFDELMNDFDRFTPEHRNKEYGEDNIKELASLSELYIKYDRDSIKMFEYLLDPIANGFVLKNVEDITHEEIENKECWTDGECVCELVEFL